LLLLFPSTLSSSDATRRDDAARTRTQTVKIDNTSDPLATVVTIEFADVLGELLDTVRSFLVWQRRSG